MRARLVHAHLFGRFLAAREGTCSSCAHALVLIDVKEKRIQLFKMYKMK